MALYINTNLASLTALRYQGNVGGAMLASMQRLSSGLRINSAKDDAAGLAIASRMTAQVNGFSTAIRNANDAVSLLQTSEGAIATIGDMLQRMRQLAVEAANATPSEADREALNHEMQQLSSGVGAIAASAEFNGFKLLDGSFGTRSFQVGDQSADAIVMTLSSMLPSMLGSTGTKLNTAVTGTEVLSALTDGDLTLNGTAIGNARPGTSQGQEAASAYANAAAINAVAQQSGVTATADGAVIKGVAPTSLGTIAAGTFSINGVTFGSIAGDGTAAGQGKALVAEIESKVALTGVDATSDATGAVTLKAIAGRNINFGMTGVAASAAAAAADKTQFLAQTGFDSAVVGSEATLPVASKKLIGFSGAVTARSVQINGVNLTITGANASAAANDLLLKIQAAQANPTTASALGTFAARLGASSGSVEIDDVVPGISQALISTAAVPGASVTTLVAGEAGNAASVGVTRGTVTLSSNDKNGILIAGSNPNAIGLSVQQVAAVPVETTIGIDTLDLLSAGGAQNAITSLDAALQSVGDARSTLGAYQNRFLTEIDNLQNQVVDLLKSRNCIEDADYAVESASLMRSRILQEAGIAMLAQANSLPTLVLSLLKSV